MEHPIGILENERARLIPLSQENYTALKKVAADPGLIRYSPGILHTPEGFEAYFRKAFEDSQSGLSIPFLIFDIRAGEAAGSTRFMRIDRTNRVLEIGSTWLGLEFQGTGLNAAVKQLLLREAFGPMKFERVEFRVDERNARSRRAVEKLGARLEGTLRRNVLLSDGYKRNTCVYGLLREEWSRA